MKAPPSPCFGSAVPVELVVQYKTVETGGLGGGGPVANLFAAAPTSLLVGTPVLTCSDLVVELGVIAVNGLPELAAEFVTGQGLALLVYPNAILAPDEGKAVISL